MMESPQTRQRFGNAEFDLSNLLLTVDGVARELEPKSFRLLAFLIENRRRVVPKDEILSVVWEGVAVSDNALTRAIAQVRKSLDDDPKQPRYIETIPTVGYRFIAEVADVTPGAPLPPPSEIPPPPRYRRLGSCGSGTGRRKPRGGPFLRRGTAGTIHGRTCHPYDLSRQRIRSDLFAGWQSGGFCLERRPG